MAVDAKIVLPAPAIQVLIIFEDKSLANNNYLRMPVTQKTALSFSSHHRSSSLSKNHRPVSGARRATTSP